MKSVAKRIAYQKGELSMNNQILNEDVMKILDMTPAKIAKIALLSFAEHASILLDEQEDNKEDKEFNTLCDKLHRIVAICKEAV